MRHIILFCICFVVSIVAYAAMASGPAHQPMLAGIYPGTAPVTEYWVSEKLDGVRGHWDGTALWTRGGNRINAPIWFTRGWPETPMDGELWISRARFDQVSAIVRTAEPDETDWQKINFMVFDLPAHRGEFSQRVLAMRRITAYAIPWLQPIRQFRVEGVEDLDRRLDRLVGAGGEGLMLHHQEALYSAGRSQGLLKYKLHEDAEAQVVGYTRGQGKYAGMVGALEVESEDGRRFRLGSGLSDDDRLQPPPLGSWVTYRFNGLTSTGLPRFARFVRVRMESITPD
ncbi:DNA ligase [Halopseudomonas salina]|uniref:ATP-dependent DNA ligase n=1 Tax=Halopseudomonas salina TaxID=1323744 RepID=A0ABQ1PFI7_9GAMM|nr:DNA ligase [Halopseudomonas salina]GGC96093.1 ATP-dependent DNA ligase [Halopseudomonas salina]